MSLENTNVIREQGGDVYRIKSGAQVIIESGGVLDLKTGATVKTNGTQASAIAALTAAAGTADGTVDDVGAAFNQTTLNNNFQELATKINAMSAMLKAAGLIA